MNLRDRRGKKSRSHHRDDESHLPGKKTGKKCGPLFLSSSSSSEKRQKRRRDGEKGLLKREEEGLKAQKPHRRRMFFVCPRAFSLPCFKSLLPLLSSPISGKEKGGRGMDDKFSSDPLFGHTSSASVFPLQPRNPRSWRPARKEEKTN